MKNTLLQQTKVARLKALIFVVVFIAESFIPQRTDEEQVNRGERRRVSES